MIVLSVLIARVQRACRRSSSPASVVRPLRRRSARPAAGRSVGQHRVGAVRRRGRVRSRAPPAAPVRPRAGPPPAVAAAAADQLAERAPHARLVLRERAAQQRQHVGERVRRDAGQPARRPGRAAARRGRAACRRPPRKPSIQAAASAGGVPGERARPISRAGLVRLPAARRRAAAGRARPPDAGRRRCPQRPASCAQHGAVQPLAQPVRRLPRRSSSRPIAACARRRGGRASRPAPSASSPAQAGGRPTQIRSASPAATSRERRRVGAAHVAVAQRCGPARAAPGRGGRRRRRARRGRRAPASPPAARPAGRRAGSARPAR